MKQGQGKNKGSSFERDVCKDLSRWVSGGSRTDLFWRSASSGATAFNQRRFQVKNRTQGGDICAVGDQGNKLVEAFSIECKHVRDLMLWQGVTLGFGNTVRFWKQAQRDASSHRKRALLIARQNLVKTVVIGTTASLADLVPVNLIVLRSLRLNGTWPDGPELGIVVFEDLLKMPCPYS